MENAAREGGFFQHINQQLRQITGISGAAGLVLHHIKLVALGGGFEHGFHKIAAVFAEYPGAAHNRAVGVGGQRQQFAGELGLAVGALGCGRGGFGVGHFAAAVKHIIGGYVDEFGMHGAGGGGQARHGGGVDGKGFGALAFGQINGGVGGGVDNGVGLEIFNHIEHGFGIGDVEGG